MPLTRPRASQRAPFVILAFVIAFGLIASAARGRDKVPPAVPTNLSLVSVGVSELGLSWNPSPGADLYLVFVDGRQVASVDGRQVGSTGSPEFRFTGLACGTSFELGVAAMDHAGGGATSDRARVVAATAPCRDTQPPTAASGLRQVSGDAKSITFSWDASTDNVGVAGYHVHQGGTTIATVQTTSYTYAPSLLVCGSTYGLAVEAFDASGNRAPASVVVLTSAACGDTSAPTTPTNLHIGTTTQTSLSVSWTASKDNVGVERYLIAGGASPGTTTGTTHDALGLTCGTSYRLQVSARDAAGNTSSPAEVVASTSPCPTPPSGGTGDRQPPTAPTGLLSSGTTASSLLLAWTSSTDNVGVTGYAVFRDGTQVGTTPVAGYTVGNLTCGKSYTVGVEAYDAAGNRSSRSQAVVSTTPCPDPTKPTPPQVSLAGKTDTTVSLIWTPGVDNVGVAAYQLYKNGVGFHGNRVVGTSYTFTGLLCGATYDLGVTAVDAAGNESAMSSITVATDVCAAVVKPPAPTALTISKVTETSLTASWTSGGGTTAGYGVYLGTTTVKSAQSETTYTFTGLTCGIPYRVGIDAYDAAGNRSSLLSLDAKTAACTGSPPPPPPSSSSTALVVSTNGADTNPCTSVLPCRSFGRAYKAAAPGATVLVMAGTYPGQEISDDPAKQSGAPVVFQPSGGAVTVNGTLDFGQDQFNRLGPKGVTIKDMTITYLHAWAGSERLTWENIDAVHFDMDAVDSVVRGGDYGPCQAPRDDPSCLSRVLGNARNVLVENASFHDITSTDLGNFHVDGFAVFGGANVTLRNNKFYGNMITNIRVQNCCGNTPISNLVIENNWFAPPLQGDGVSINANGIDIDNNVPGLKIRFNSFAEGGYPQITASQSDAELTGNLFTNATCASGARYSYNVFKPWSETQGQGACGSTDKKVSTLGYASGGYALASDSPAIDAVPSSVGCPQQDLQGTSRPLGAACDAGATEVR
jgi:chitodextrinase